MVAGMSKRNDPSGASTSWSLAILGMVQAAADIAQTQRDHPLQNATTWHRYDRL
jgi:hypothetical protein